MRRVLYAASLICAVLLHSTHLGGVELQKPTAVATDIPDAVDLSYASPETWFAIPPIIDFYLKPPLAPPGKADFPAPAIKLAAVP